MALVGEAFLAGSIQVLCDKIASGELLDFFRSRKLNDSLLEKMNTTLLTLQAVLNDAEEKQIVNDDVGKWLAKLKHAVLDAEDLVDEIDTEAKRCKVENPTVKTKVWKFFSIFINPLNQDINGRIEELFQRLEQLAQHNKDVLGLRGGIGGKVSQRILTSPVVEHEFRPFGRQVDKEKLQTLLLSADGSNNISVIPILGMGGVGKTTLAKLLYNDDKVKEHFDIQAWACVSEDFDAVRVTKTLLEQINPEESKHLGNSDMSVLQVKLREQVKGKKFLFVLDDLWNDNCGDWNRLRGPVTFGERGSKVIVTTRNESVAKTVHTVSIHYLEELSQEDCWLLLEKHAFRNENLGAHPDLEEIGKKIARKCNGLPLAAETLGGLLSRNIDYKEWDDILQSNIWDLPDKSILPSLRLSYHYLPSELKQCFAYCSIFPKDYEFQKEDVILLWMAEGLIPQEGREKTVEEVGQKYFDELLSRSLLQRSRTKESSFTMHDLINDLVMFVSREFCFRLDERGSPEVPERVRHFSYMRGRFDTPTKFKPLDGVKCLRTFLPMSLTPYDEWDDDLYVTKKVPDELLRELKCLRVMSLSRYKNITQLPDCIGNHKHLRYVDLSHTAVKRLPDTVCDLHNLQTLLLLGCSSLVELPKDMRRLINLRHLDISGTNIKEMPGHMGSLESLRTLTAFVVGKSNGSGIRELRQLKHLHGKLSISKLQNVVDNSDAVGASLKEKKDLKELELAWGDGVDADDSQKEKERELLDKLQPTINLEKLAIKFYGGTRFPSWLGDSSYSKLLVMRLSDCSYCESLPSLGQLHALKELCIEGMKKVSRVGAEFYGGHGNGACLIQPFQSLEKLTFEKMPEWEEWLPSPSAADQFPDFPRLQKLGLSGCPKLRGNLPNHLSSLKKLSISGCGILHETTTVTLNTESLERLKIDGSPGLSSILDMEMVHDTNRLQHLELYNCPSLVSFPRNGLPSTLTRLSIINCGRLEFLSHEMMSKLDSLEILWLDNCCHSMRSFPLGIFPKLEALDIRNCENLESLSIEGVDENLSHLYSMRIWGCPNLVSFPQGGLPTPNLASLSVNECENLKLFADRIHTLTALGYLRIGDLPNLVSFAEGGLPPNLHIFTVSFCNKLKPSVEWGLQGLVSLGTFYIRASEDVLETMLKEQLLPTTLHSLEISDQSSLKSLEGKGLQHLTSLQNLEIEGCKSLEFLAKEGLPESLSFLRIEDCPSLKKKYENKRGEAWRKRARIPCTKIARIPCIKKHYQNKRGEEWRKIAGIPCIKIDEEVII